MVIEEQWVLKDHFGGQVTWFSFEGVLEGSTKDGEWALYIEETAGGSVWV